MENLKHLLNGAMIKAYSDGNHKATMIALFSDGDIGLHRVVVKPEFDTACWIPPVGPKGSHVICLGDRMLARVIEFWANQCSLPKPTPASKGISATRALNARIAELLALASTEQVAKLEHLLFLAVVAYGVHEREHALSTPRDLKAINAELKVLKLPFSLFNLFEDARIEEAARNRHERKFDWILLEDLCPTATATALMLRCVQLEGNKDEPALNLEEPLGETGKTVAEAAKRIGDYYYPQAAKAPNARALYPLMLEFQKEFQPEPESDKDKGDKGEGDGDSEGEGEGCESKSKGKGSSSSPKGEPGKDKPKDKSKGPGDKGETEEAEASEGYGSGDAQDRAQDLSVAAEAAEKGEEFIQEFLEDAEIVDGNDAEAAEAKAKAKAKAKAAKDNADKKPKNDQGIPDSVTPEASGGRAREQDFLANNPGAVDDAFQARVTAVTQTLLKIFKGKEVKAVSEKESSRISTRHAFIGKQRGTTYFVHKAIIGGLEQKEFSVLYDCSGSMQGYADREGKVLLLALNNLAKRGYLVGNLILSGWVANKPGWLSFKFPVKPEIILRINPGHGHEGLQACLEDNLRTIKAGKEVFVYTDACITDAPLDKEALAKKGIKPIGLYVGPDSKTSEMQRHFPVNFISSTVEELVIRLVKHGKKR